MELFVRAYVFLFSGPNNTAAILLQFFPFWYLLIYQTYDLMINLIYTPDINSKKRLITNKIKKKVLTRGRFWIEEYAVRANSQILPRYETL